MAKNAADPRAHQDFIVPGGRAGVYTAQRVSSRITRHGAVNQALVT
jgi:hypothetical protein